MDKLYKTIIKIEVLSNGPYAPENIENIAHDIIEGDCSGTWDIESEESLSELEMAAALQKQGSDPGFLLGDDWENWESKLHESEEQ